MSKLSAKVGKEPGDWFGCSTISYVLEMANKKYDHFNDFTLAVFNDGVLYLNDILLKASISCKCNGVSNARVVREEDDCNSSYELVVSAAGRLTDCGRSARPRSRGRRSSRVARVTTCTCSTSTRSSRT